MYKIANIWLGETNAFPSLSPSLQKEEHVSYAVAFEKIRQQEVLKNLEKLTPDIQNELNKATQNMAKKLLQVKMPNRQNV